MSRAYRSLVRRISNPIRPLGNPEKNHTDHPPQAAPRIPTVLPPRQVRFLGVEVLPISLLRVPYVCMYACMYVCMHVCMY